MNLTTAAAIADTWKLQIQITDNQDRLPLEYTLLNFRL